MQAAGGMGAMGGMGGIDQQALQEAMRVQAMPLIAAAVAARRAEQGVLVVSGIPAARADGVVGCCVAVGLLAAHFWKKKRSASGRALPGMYSQYDKAGKHWCAHLLPCGVARSPALAG